MRKNQKKSFFIFVLCLIVQTLEISYAFANLENFSLCPLCNSEGIIICPAGFKAACANEKPDDTIPKCIFYENKYIPGCWKFIGVNKLDFNFGALKMPPSAMIEIIGGGETYTLNRDIVGCKKL